MKLPSKFHLRRWLMFDVSGLAQRAISLIYTTDIQLQNIFVFLFYFAY